MATLGEFSSLLQLGFGIGIGLSLFRAPVDLRTAKLAREIDGDLAAIRGVASEVARTKRRGLMTLKLRFANTRRELDSKQIPFMIAALLGALANLAGLIAASSDAQRTLSSGQQAGLIFLSSGYFLLLALCLEVLARWYLTALFEELKRVRS
jgi:hypothetical protein